MIPGRGVPLRDRPVAPLRSDAAPPTHVRALLGDRTGRGPRPWPGLVLEWRRDSIDWSALVVYAITAETVTTTVQTWVPAGHLRPS